MPITEDDLKYLFGAESKIVKVDPASETITAINDTLVAMDSWGINPKRVRTADFEDQTVVVVDQSHGAAPPRFYLVFKHKMTERFSNHDLAQIRKYGTYVVANELIALAEPAASDE